MKKIYDIYNNFSKQIKDSIIVSISILGLISTVLSIIGISLGDADKLSIWNRIAIVVATFLVLILVSYAVLGKLFEKNIMVKIHSNQIEIKYGNIFQEPGLRIIGCDAQFSFIVDDIIISKRSLQGQFMMDHCDIEELKRTIDLEAERLGLQKCDKGRYTFPRGSVICYENSKEGYTYILVAMNLLNEQYEARTNMMEYQLTLMKMWKEIDRVYAGRVIVVPVLGDGMSRFDDGPKSKSELLQCMMWTLNSSAVTFKSKLKFVIYKGGDKDCEKEKISLYEFRDIF